MSDIIHLMTYLINIRERRQVTLPKKVLDQLLVGQGDRLVVKVVDQNLIATPVKNQTLLTLKAIQQAFKKAKITEAELQKSGEMIRKELGNEFYG